jgi:LPXTG-motif cell wall-anchored protein
VSGAVIVALLMAIALGALLWAGLVGIGRFVPERWRPPVMIGFFAASAVYFWVQYGLQMSRGEGGNWYTAAAASLVAIGTLLQWRRRRV